MAYEQFELTAFHPISSMMATAGWTWCRGTIMMDLCQRGDFELSGDILLIMRMYYLPGVMGFEVR